MSATRDIITSFVVSTFQFGSPGVQIEYGTSFLETGLMDSMRVLELVDFLEGRFGIVVEDTELVPENLDSIRNICTYLESKGVSDGGG
jgi:acyl carrier protein